MKANRDKAIHTILKHEGGYVNHPADPGGCTNLGITISTYRAHINPNGTCSDLRNLTLNQAVEIYGAEYWDKINGDNLPAGVDLSVFDFAVNAGPGRAARMLQRLVGVGQDGQIGKATLAAVWDTPLATLINDYAKARLAYYRSLPTFGTFGKGWTQRTEETRSIALSMWVAAPPNSPDPDISKLTDIVLPPADMAASISSLRVLLTTWFSEWPPANMQALPGEAATRKLQRMLGVEADAVIGRETAVALAHWIMDAVAAFEEPNPQPTERYEP